MMLGVLPVCRKTQHRSQITFKENPKHTILRNEADPRDQRPDRFHRLRVARDTLKTLVKCCDLLAIQLRHVRMKQGRRGRGIGQPFLNLRLARFKLTYALFEA
ncbi:hypothetical protein [Acetobacter indonesiensis]|uniref:hypothetical protein n=1 Tax=Acetobacter indonesiensis TaxID=104101 RepID=UPI003442691E